MNSRIIEIMLIVDFFLSLYEGRCKVDAYFINVVKMHCDQWTHFLPLSVNNVHVNGCLSIMFVCGRGHIVCLWALKFIR